MWLGVSPVPARMGLGVSPVQARMWAWVGRVPVQMWSPRQRHQEEVSKEKSTPIFFSLAPSSGSASDANVSMTRWSI